MHKRLCDELDRSRKEAAALWRKVDSLRDSVFEARGEAKDALARIATLEAENERLRSLMVWAVRDAGGILSLRSLEAENERLRERLTEAGELDDRTEEV